MNIGYVNARIRGMKSRLFDRPYLDRLLLKPDLASIITELEKTSYKEDIEKASVHHSGIHCIEEALRLNITRTSRLILQMVEGEPFEKYIKVLLNKWDIQNIKTILRGKNIHITPEEVLECLVPAGELDEVTLIELVKQPDVKAVIDLLSTWDYSYGRILTQYFSQYAKRRNMAVFEYNLDKYYYKKGLSAFPDKSYNDTILRDLFQTEIDIINIKTILRLIRDNITAEDGKSILLEYGKFLDMDDLMSMIRSQSIDEAMAHLEFTPYNFLNQVRSGKANGVNVSVYEKELDRYLIEKGVQLLRGDPLSIAIPVGYLAAKDNEIKNIRIIARGKMAYIPEDELKEELMYV